jgi:hypothetical protein
VKEFPLHPRSWDGADPAAHTAKREDPTTEGGLRDRNHFFSDYEDELESFAKPADFWG